MKPLVREVESDYLRKDIPFFRPGDTITVAVKIVEGDKERLQDYTGVVIARRGGGMRETITVRRVSSGVGMERIFPLHSPRIDSIKIKRRGRVRRAKLYYLRDLRGKKARLTERRVSAEKLQAEASVAHAAMDSMIAVAEEAQNAIAAEAAAAEATAAPETPTENKTEE